MGVFYKIIKSFLDEEDFKDVPVSVEDDGVYQIIFFGKKIFARNMETGEISIH